VTQGAGKTRSATKKAVCPIRYEAAKLEGLYPVLDGIAWMDAPSATQLAQFSGADARTVGKLLKNAEQIGMISRQGTGYVLLVPYPYDGTEDQKQHAVKDALLRMPLLVSAREFLKLGDTEPNAIRKAATVRNIVPFEAASFAPLIDWARKLQTIDDIGLFEDVIDEAVAAKEVRHQEDQKVRIAFLSHSSHDKPFIRKLAADLKVNGVQVWLDEINIKVGESIPDKISQGLAESDYFLFASSKNSIASEWVKKELNSALLKEVEKRAVTIFPIKLDDSAMPTIIADKKYADFSQSYKKGLEDLLRSMGVNLND
jgi:TIR domain